MKYLPLLLGNLGRRKLRTLLTVGSFAVSLLLFGLLVVIGRAMDQGAEVAGADRLVVRNRTSIIMPLPYAHRDRIAAVDGVEAVTYAVWFGGVYQDERNFFAQFAIDAETWRDVYPDYRIPEDQWAAFLADRTGAVVGRDLARRFGLEVGDRVPLRGTIFPGTWEFTVRAVYEGDAPEDPTMDMWLRYDYLEERRPFFKGTVGWYMVGVADGADAAAVAAAIDARFANSPWETRSETEKAFAAGWANQMGNIRLLLLSVGAIVFVTLLLVAGNTMAIAVRERLGELAVLQTLGFTRLRVLGLLAAEGGLMALVGGGAGIALAKLLTLGSDPTGGMLPILYLAPREMAAGLVAAVLVGAAAGALPTGLALRRPVAAVVRGV